MPVFVDHKLKLTYDDLREIPEDDPYRHEIIDGMHVARSLWSIGSAPVR